MPYYCWLQHQRNGRLWCDTLNFSSLNNEENIVELLCSNDALVEKRFYFAIPDPITIAEQLGYNDIHEVLLAADAPPAEDHKTVASVFMIPSSSTAPLKKKRERRRRPRSF